MNNYTSSVGHNSAGSEHKHGALTSRFSVSLIPCKDAISLCPLAENQVCLTIKMIHCWSVPTGTVNGLIGILLMVQNCQKYRVGDQAKK